MKDMIKEIKTKIIPNTLGTGPGGNPIFLIIKQNNKKKNNVNSTLTNFFILLYIY